MIYYFIKDGDNELGPFTLKQLTSRSITKDTPVWFAGLQEWTTAGQVCEIRELFVIKSSSRSPKSIMTKIWDNSVLKQSFKKASYQFILIKVRKSFY